MPFLEFRKIEKGVAGCGMPGIDVRYVKAGIPILLYGGGGILCTGGGVERRKGSRAHGH